MQVCPSHQPVFNSFIFSGNQPAHFNMTSASPSPTIPVTCIILCKSSVFHFIKQLMICAYRGSFHEVPTWSSHGTYLLIYSRLPYTYNVAGLHSFSKPKSIKRIESNTFKLKRTISLPYSFFKIRPTRLNKLNWVAEHDFNSVPEAQVYLQHFLALNVVDFRSAVHYFWLTQKSVTTILRVMK